MKSCFVLAPALAFAILTFAETAPAAETAAEIVEVRKIWDEAPHNAFTDLVRWKDQYYVCYRVGTAHNSTDGEIHVMRSPDMRTWTPAAAGSKARCESARRSMATSMFPMPGISMDMSAESVRS